MDFKTSLDAPARALTWGGCALFGILSLYQLYTYSRSPRETVDAAAAAVQIAIFAVIPLFTWLYSPQGYSVRDGALVIHRPWKPVTIPLAEIRSVQLLSPEDVTPFSGLRVFGGRALRLLRDVLPAQARRLRPVLPAQQAEPDPARNGGGEAAAVSGFHGADRGAQRGRVGAVGPARAFMPGPYRLCL